MAPWLAEPRLLLPTPPSCLPDHVWQTPRQVSGSSGSTPWSTSVVSGMGEWSAMVLGHSPHALHTGSRAKTAGHSSRPTTSRRPRLVGDSGSSW